MKKRNERERMFAIGVVFVGAGVVFLTRVNRGVGLGLMIVGGVFMWRGKRIR